MTSFQHPAPSYQISAKRLCLFLDLAQLTKESVEASQKRRKDGELKKWEAKLLKIANEALNY